MDSKGQTNLACIEETQPPPYAPPQGGAPVPAVAYPYTVASPPPQGQPVAYPYTVASPPPQAQPVVQQSTNVVVNQVASSPAIVIQETVKPRSHMCLACVVLWLCNPVAGLIAFFLSLASQSSEDVKTARRLGLASMWMSLIGIVATIIIIIVISTS